MKKYLQGIYIKLLLMISLLCNACLLSGCDLIYVASLSVLCGVRPELSVKPEKWPIAVVGEQYKIELIIEGQDALISYVLVAQGELPPGLQLIHREREDVFEITGIPEQKGEYSFAIKMGGYGTQCVGQTGEQDFIVRVMAST